MEIRDLASMRKYIDKKVQGINSTAVEAERSTEHGFPFTTEYLAGYKVTEDMSVEIAGAAHYLIYYRAYDNADLQMLEQQEENPNEDGPVAGEFNFSFLTEEIDLFYKPYDADSQDPQAPVKVFGVGTYISADENHVGWLHIAAPSSGESAVCLIFKVVPADLDDDDWLTEEL